jgi:hypothetical protein
MNASIHALAAIYRESSPAKSGTLKDYTLDWEKFLRAAGLHDGDDRELAEQDLLVAERASGGMLVIDRHPRTGAKQVIRLKREGGEAWLFAAVGLLSPAEERESLGGFFEGAAGIAVPCGEAWRAWCEGLAARAREGASVAPFRRDDATGNRSLLEALAGVLNWREESLVRYASAVICRDSKALESLRPRLLAALREITGREEASLEDFGISDKPRSVLIHGPLVLQLPDGSIDFGLLAGPVSVSAIDLAAAKSVECRANLCLTVENESVFLEFAKRRTGVLLVQTSFPGAATRLLFERLPADLECRHFGDSDPAGFDVLRDLREKTGREFRPLMMRFRPMAGAPDLTEEERRVIGRLLGCDLMADVHAELRAMLEAGTKGDFEQESVGVDGALTLVGLDGLAD